MSVPLREAREPLVVFGNGHGDHLLNLPALRALAWGFGGRMTLVCFPGARRDFFSDLPARRVVELPFRRRPRDAMQRELPPWDALIWLNPWTSKWLDFLLEQTPAGRSIGLFRRFGHSVPRNYGKHSADLAFDIVQEVFPRACFDHYDQPPTLPPKATTWADKVRGRIPADRRLLVVHADTGEEKRWSPERFRAALESFLAPRPDFVVVIVGLHDTGLEGGPFADRIISALGSPVPHSMALVGRADLFLGIDSCFLHAADFFRVPAVGLFGPTEVHEFGFRLDGIHQHVDGRGSMHKISVDAVIEALAAVEERVLTRTIDPAMSRRDPDPSLSSSEIHRRHVYSSVEGSSRLFWDIERLWKQARGEPVLDLCLEAIDLDQTVWFEPGEKPTVRKVADHLRRVLATNPDHPVILRPNGELMDGWHRLVKAWIEGRESIPGIRLPKDPLPDFIEEI